MRIRISHTIGYDYAEPARHITQILRLTPRDHDGQRSLLIETRGDEILQLPERRQRRQGFGIDYCWDFPKRTTHGHRHSHAKMKRQRYKLFSVP